MNKLGRIPAARIKPKRLEQFLTSLANLPKNPELIRAFVQRFSDFDLVNERMMSLQLRADFREEYVTDLNDLVERLVIPYARAFFRAVWTEPNARTREWAIVIFRSDLARMDEPLGRGAYLSLRDGPFTWIGLGDRVATLPQPPEELPIERAFEYLLRRHDRARYCPSPDCAAPYFFSARHTQRYCSESCAQSAERESKRRWWAKQGAAMRKKKNQKTRRSVGRKKQKKEK